MATTGRLLNIVLMTLLVQLCISWDTDDFEIFDVVEEVNMNFYEMLEINDTVSTADIRRAYRRLSRQLHPDKNKAEDADAQFRKLVAVYEILKDDDKRQRYDRVLVEGMPDWRQPVFYYRRVRKLGMLELAGLLSVILTIGQYLVAWAVYFEKRLNMEDFYASKKQKLSEKSKKKSRAGVEELEEEIEEQLKSLPRPRLLDLWMFRLPGFLLFLARSLPPLLVALKEHVRPQKEEEEEEEEEEDEKESTRVKRKKAEIPEYQAALYEGLKNGGPVEDNVGDILATEMEHKILKEGQWTEEELIILAKAVNKFPGGTVKRWEKIADFVGRTVEEVTQKLKEVKGATYAVTVSSSIQGNAFGAKSKKKDWDISDNIITVLDNPKENGDDNRIRKRNKATKPVETAGQTVTVTSNQCPSSGVSQGLDISSEGTVSSCRMDEGDVVKNESLKERIGDDTWTQNQQMIFEWALKHNPKGMGKRWDKIAEHIPGKNKEECIQRFKYLSELVKKKKEGQRAVQI